MIKKYCLLETGEIENCYYDKELTELRNIYKIGARWYIDHDVFGNGCCIMFHHRILRFSNTKKELKDWWKTNERNQN